VNPEVAAGFERFLDNNEPEPIENETAQESQDSSPEEPPATAVEDEQTTDTEQEAEESTSDEESSETRDQTKGVTEDSSEETIDTFGELAEVFEAEERDLLEHLTIDGREGEGSVSLASVVDHYRTSAASEEAVIAEQESFRADLRTEIDGRMQELQQATARIVQRIEQNAEPPGGWDKLRQENPSEYIRLNEQRQADHAAARAAIDAMEAEAERVKGEESKQYEAFTERETEKLYRLRPDWRDKATGRAAFEDIQGYLNKHGFSEDQQNALVDAASIITVWKAAQHDKAQAAKPGLKKRLRKLPTKHVRASARDETAPAREAAQARQARLDHAKKTGNLDDLAPFFAEHVE
jgi:hypothetical protein